MLIMTDKCCNINKRLLHDGTGKRAILKHLIADHLRNMSYNYSMNACYVLRKELSCMVVCLQRQQQQYNVTQYFTQSVKLVNLPQ